MKRILICLLLAALAAGSAQAKIYRLASPNGRTTIEVNDQGRLTWSVSHNGQRILAPSVLSMNVAGKEIGDLKVKSAKTEKVQSAIAATFWRQMFISYTYNQMELTLSDGWSVVFRAYDKEGVAYRFESSTVKKDERVFAETAEFNFTANHTAYVPYSSGGKENPFRTSFESRYTVAPLSEFREDEVAFSPLLVCLENGLRVEITDSDIESYPGMFLRKGLNPNSLRAEFAPYPAEVEETPRRGQVVVKSYTDYIAVIREPASKQEPRRFPWRVLAIAESDTGLPVNNLVYLLASPSRVRDYSWIRPGKVAWDWWNWWNITGVDFTAGINTKTYKYYIDFAAKNGIEYVVLDEGWSDPLDIMRVKPVIDLRELCRYAKTKNVGLVLWAVSYVLDKDLEKACKTYSSMGIKGFKVDFMDRDDQTIPEQLYRIAEMAAAYHLFLDFHGMYKPAGMNRTWPNVLNFEGVWGLEQMKWSTDDMVEYDVTFPFIRMLSGPVDYTPGAMRNQLKDEYTPNNNNPSSQGTRARQVAEYIVFDAPFEMLCDNPSAYMKEQETTDFITDIPTIWDETRILQGEIGKYLVTARRRGSSWYVGGLTNWDARDITLDLSGLVKGTHAAKLYRDGVNATRNATDYAIDVLDIPTNKPFLVHLAPGGGFALVIE